MLDIIHFQELHENAGPVEVNTNLRAEIVKKFTELGFNLQISERARSRLLNGTQLRVKLGLDSNGDTAVMYYDWTRMEDERWIPLTEFDRSDFNDPVFDDDRSEGLLQIMGERKFSDLVKWTEKKGQEEALKGVKGRSNTKGRVLLQIAADLFTLAVCSDDEYAETREKVLGKLNRRLWKWYRRKLVGQELEDLNAKFANTGLAEPTAELLSVSVESVTNLWEYLKSSKVTD